MIAPRTHPRPSVAPYGERELGGLRGDVSLGIGGTFTGAFVGEHVLVWQGATIEAASVL